MIVTPVLMLALTPHPGRGISAILPNFLQEDAEAVLRRRLEALETDRAAGLLDQATHELREIGALGTEQAIDALTDLVFRLEGRLQFAAVHAIALSGHAYARERLRDLATDRQHPQVRRQAVLDLAHGSEADRLWLRDKRLQAERDPLLRSEMLRLLLEADVPRLESAVLAAARSAHPVAAEVGLAGIGRLRLSRGYPLLARALHADDPVLRRTAIAACHQFGGAKVVDALLDAYADPANLLQQADIARVLWQCESPEEMAALARHGLGSKTPAVLRLSADILSARSTVAPQATMPALSQLLRADDPDLVIRAAEGLARLQPPGLGALLAARLRQMKDTDTALSDLLWALAESQQLPPRLRPQLLEWAASAPPSVRQQCLRLLALGERDEAAVELATDALHEGRWQLRQAAIDCISRWQHVDDLPLLITTLANAHGRTRESLHAQLVAWVGQDLGPSPLAWQAWWDAHPEPLQLPLAPATDGLPLNAEEGQHRTVAQRRFFGLPVPDGGVLFMLDASGSMAAAAAGGASRFTAFSEELLSALEHLSPANRFDLLLFSATPQLWQGELTAATPPKLEAAAQFLNQAKVGGPTDLGAALSAALHVPEVETIFLLSDGAPTSGASLEAEALLQEVARQNRHLSVRLEVIDLGEGASPLLQRLAEENDGHLITAGRSSPLSAR